MRLVFLGSDAIALPALEFLRDAPGVDLIGVVSQPDRPAGRGKHLHANPVAAWARAQHLPLRQPARPGPEELEWLRAECVDAALVMAYGHILRADFLHLPPRGVWNLHASLLPAYRGASPIEAAIAAGETATGVCLMQVVMALDAGPVADCERVPISSAATGASVRAQLAQACVPLLARNLEALAAGTLALKPQDDASATYTRKLTKADAQLDFTAPALALERRIRALQPWPGAQVADNGSLLKIGAAEVLAETSAAAPGTLLRASSEGVDIATGEGVLRVLEVQRPGGRMLPAGEFLRGHPLPAGTVWPSQPMAPLVSPRPFPRVPPGVAPR